MNKRTKKVTGIIGAIGGLFVLMAGIFMAVVSALAVTAALLPLRKQENREMIVGEYNKAKENPKGYAQNVQHKVTDKAGQYQERAMNEYNKAKENPKGYAQNVQEKAKSQVEKVKEDPKSYGKDAKSRVDNRIQSGKQHFQEATDEGNDAQPGTGQ
ncbi:YtxH domain-containing protein [Salinicoccus sp. Marseille-QA3877]